ncbi:MAG: Hsp33 family molecular chaperone HslO [Pseudomonadota bacterium]
MSEPPDTVLRAITDDGAFRVITARTTQTVRGAIEAQGVTGQTARHFGDLLTGSILFRETMAPNLRVQGIIKGSSGSGSLIADSHPSGQTRGLVQLKGGAREIDLGQGAVLQLMRTWQRAHQSRRGRGAQGRRDLAFLHVLHADLEQVISMLAVDTLFEGDRVHSAGGYIVQLLPEVGRGPLMVMTERLRDFESIDAQLGDSAFTPSWLLDELLYGMPFTRLEESPVRFECWCDELRVVSALASLSRDDIEHLLSTNEVLEIACEYCKRDFRIAPARLRGLLEQS